MADQKRTPARRKQTRLPHHDYAAPGYYFFTAVTRGRARLFGEIVDEAMVRNRAGDAVEATWLGLPMHYPHLRLDAFVVMPNHVHGMLAGEDVEAVRAGHRPAPTAGMPLGTTGEPNGSRRHGLPEIMRAFKAYSARAINEARGSSGAVVWQRGYFDRVIRDDDELEWAREYIRLNPLKWHLDEENGP